MTESDFAVISNYASEVCLGDEIPFVTTFPDTEDEPTSNALVQMSFSRDSESKFSDEETPEASRL